MSIGVIAYPSGLDASYQSEFGDKVECHKAIASKTSDDSGTDRLTIGADADTYGDYLQATHTHECASALVQVANPSAHFLADTIAMSYNDLSPPEKKCYKTAMYYVQALQEVMSGTATPYPATLIPEEYTNPSID